MDIASLKYNVASYQSYQYFT